MNRLEQIVGISALALSIASCATVGSVRQAISANSRSKYVETFGTDKVDIVYSENTCRRLMRLGYCALKNDKIFEMKYDEESYNISSGAGYQHCSDPEANVMEEISDIGHEVMCNVFVLEDKTGEREAIKLGRKCVSGTFYSVTPKN